MSRKKKGLALWLALFLGVSSLTGCGSGNDNMTQLSQKGADIMSSSSSELLMISAPKREQISTVPMRNRIQM